MLSRLNGFFARYPYVVYGLLLLGIGLRFLVMLRGHNFDMESWRLAADITAHQGNIYAETHRYNYGPLWSELIHIFDRVAQWTMNPYHAFRVMLVGLLIAADVGIWYLLRKKFGVTVAFLFFLNPISIIITGYHNQFDGLAIFTALLAVIVYGDKDTGMTKRKWWGLGLLGLSLTVKHVFFLFPLWLAVRQRGWREKLIVLTVPIAIFLASFLPYLPEGGPGIMKNVFGYASFNNAPLWYVWLPDAVQALLQPKVLFFGALIAFAFVMRRRSVVESLLMYTIVLVAFSAAIANQYLAIACAAIAVFPNVWFGFYALFSTLLLALSPAGLQSGKLATLLPHPLTTTLSADARAYDLPIAVLGIGLVWHFYRDQLLRVIGVVCAWIRAEFVFQQNALRR